MTKWMKWVFGIFMGIGIVLLCLVIFWSYVRSNVRTYGLYYAAQYYGKDNYYELLNQDLYTNKNPKEIRQKKGLFELSKPDKNKTIYLYGISENDENGINVYDGGASGVIISVSNLPKSYLIYNLGKDNKLYFDTNYQAYPNGDKKPKNYDGIYKRDTQLYREKVGKYLDIQLKAIGKPKVNLQKLYNWAQS